MAEFGFKSACFTPQSKLFTTTLAHLTFHGKLTVRMKDFSTVCLDIYIIHSSFIINNPLLRKYHDCY